jgi:hypothetical protein
LDVCTEEEKKERRRRYLKSQRKYRDRIRCAEESLKLDVNSLRQQILDLKQLRTILETKSLWTRASTTGSAAHHVQEYFRLFQYGFKLGVRRIGGGQPRIDGQEEALGLKQKDFLGKFLDQDLLYGDIRGIQTYIDQWEKYCRCHTHMKLKMLSMEVTGPEEAPLVSVKSVLYARLTRDAIEMIFPHLLSNEVLSQRLIGLKITYPMLKQFYFGGEGKVVRYEANVNFIEALSGALGGINDVSIIMSDANVHDDFIIGEIPEKKASSVPSTPRRMDVEFLLS